MSENNSHDAVSFGRVLEWLAVLFLLAMLCCLLLPAVQHSSSAAPHPCKRNLKMIGLALHNYHEAHGTFPPAYLTDSSGNPALSWRIQILPFLDDASK